jgi:hypothetical protein
MGALSIRAGARRDSIEQKRIKIAKWHR